MSQRAVIQAFRAIAGSPLAELGFKGRGGHFVRREGEVVQVVELQHSIYGGRVTANLGIDLSFLEPVVRWIPRPAIGPHAHDCARWVRIGLVRPERKDAWWSFGGNPGDATVEEAVQRLSRAVLDYGVPWLVAESAPDCFRRHAEGALDRSRSPRSPEGSFLALRLLASVSAWAGDLSSARRAAMFAREAWGEQRAQLEGARAQYAEGQPRAGLGLPPVPDLLMELDQIIERPRAGSSRPAGRLARQRRRSK